MNIVRFETLDSLFRELTDRFIILGKDSLSVNGSFNVAISGGKTPLPLYQNLGGAGEALNWSRVNFFWVDERWVEFNSDQHNGGSAVRSGLGKLKTNFHFIETEDSSPELSARGYQHLIGNLLGGQGFDLIILGSGTDGHTASVFDNGPSVVADESVIVTAHPQTGQTRISLSLPLICRAKAIWLIITGAEKASLLRELPKLKETPVQYVLDHATDTLIYTDILDE